MSAFTSLTWWGSNGLIALLLALFWKRRLIGKYPVFFAYLFFLLLAGVVRYYVLAVYPDEYLPFYWYTEFLSLAGGYAIIWQIYFHTLQPYPGSARMSRVVVSAVFAAIWAHVLFMILFSRTEEFYGRVLLMERNLHSVQAVLMLIFLSLVVYYRIPLGRNLKGLAIGYGLYIATSLVTLTLRSSLGVSFQLKWDILSQISVLISLAIWTVAFRDYQPNPLPEGAMNLERDYELVTRRTGEAIEYARGLLTRTLMQ